MHHQELSYSLNQFYRTVGISKQAVNQHLNRFDMRKEYERQLLKIVLQIRKDHPTMGIRTLYSMIDPPSMGRDLFEDFCNAHGLGIKKQKNYKRTTDSTGVKRFPNRLLEFTPSHSNQVWVSDITYYELNGRFYYITLIADQYSKFIKGYSLSDSLRTSHTTVPALSKALRKFKPVTPLIFHSDGGGQYYSDEFAAAIKGLPILQSMSYDVYENPMAESLNNVIKNKYLKPWKPKSFEQLQILLDRAVSLYNFQKPHSSLQNSTPADIEFCNKFISDNPPKVNRQRPKSSKPLVRRIHRFMDNQLENHHLGKIQVDK